MSGPASGTWTQYSVPANQICMLYVNKFVIFLDFSALCVCMQIWPCFSLLCPGHWKSMVWYISMVPYHITIEHASLSENSFDFPLQYLLISFSPMISFDFFFLCDIFRFLFPLRYHTPKVAHPVNPSSSVCKGGIKIGKIIAPNAIFRVVSCLYILYDLTCSIWWQNSTYSLSYEA